MKRFCRNLTKHDTYFFPRKVNSYMYEEVNVVEYDLNFTRLLLTWLILTDYYSNTKTSLENSHSSMVAYVR